MKKLLLSLLMLLSTIAFAKIDEVTESQLPTLVKESKVPVVIEFYATWCGPCQIMAKTMEKVDEHYAGKIHFVKMDVDKNPKAAVNVSAIPTVLIVKDGQGVGMFVGATNDPKDVVKNLDKLLFGGK